MRSPEEIEEILNEAIVLQSEGQVLYPGSGYVGGVVATLQWLIEDEDETPVPLP